MKTGTFRIALLTLLSLAACGVYAHGGGNWDPFTIDRVNNDARARIVEFQGLISNLISERSKAESWPPPELRRARELLHYVKEEVDEILEHYVSEGVNVQSAETIRAEPRVGRTLAATRALHACIGLIDRASADVESQDGLIAEFYAQGPANYLYELAEAHRDRMDLYAQLTAIAGQSEAGSE